MPTKVMPFFLFSYEILKKNYISLFPFYFSKINQLQHIKLEVLLKTKLLQIIKKMAQIKL